MKVLYTELQPELMNELTSTYKVKKLEKENTRLKFKLVLAEMMNNHRNRSLYNNLLKINKTLEQYKSKILELQFEKINSQWGRECIDYHYINYKSKNHGFSTFYDY